MNDISCFINWIHKNQAAHEKNRVTFIDFSITTIYHIELSQYTQYTIAPIGTTFGNLQNL
jgi:hypothetical protein